ncbi:lachesin [Diachasmimorpha longicaudata]|uniref:lachesin n=1 Tax=Diachasmimorpha longicaudata TaxID=58733 RepID=UPI0030B86D95
MIGRFVIAVVALQIVTVCAQRTPVISYISQQQIKDIGGTVELHCSVQYALDHAVVWVKNIPNGEPITLSSRTTLIMKETRFSLRYDQSTSTFTLQIKDIQEIDAGIYTCKVYTSLVSDESAQVELQVRRPPYISDNSTRAIVVSENEPVELYCYAGGFPTPRISWIRENRAVLPTGGSIYRGNVLKITSIRKEDRGTYYCVAENEVGRADRRNINVEVEFAPVITAPRPHLQQALQYDMDLECHVEAYPPPAISWLKDDMVLSNNQHHSISHFATADEYTDTTIRIITIEKRQYGDYVCKAVNKLGSAETKVNLGESVVPVCPPACGQGHYGTGALPVSSGPLVALVMMVAVILRNISTKY